MGTGRLPILIHRNPESHLSPKQTIKYQKLEIRLKTPRNLGTLTVQTEFVSRKTF